MHNPRYLCTYAGIHTYTYLHRCMTTKNCDKHFGPCANVRTLLSAHLFSAYVFAYLLVFLRAGRWGAWRWVWGLVVRTRYLRLGSQYGMQTCCSAHCTCMRWFGGSASFSSFSSTPFFGALLSAGAHLAAKSAIQIHVGSLWPRRMCMSCGMRWLAAGRQGPLSATLGRTCQGLQPRAVTAGWGPATVQRLPLSQEVVARRCIARSPVPAPPSFRRQR